jgi:hypothetical protein
MSETPADLSAAPLFAAVAAVVTGVGGLAATGLLGQVERNHASAFGLALGATIGGTFLAAVATSGLLGDATAHPTRIRIVRGVGAVAVCVGVLIATIVAVVTASDNAKPTIDVTLTPVPLPAGVSGASRTYQVDAETKADDLPAGARVTILVDGLHYDMSSRTYAPTNLFHGKYGPDNDGVIDLHTRINVTRGNATDGSEFDAIGVQAAIAYSEQSLEANPCGVYAKQVSTNSNDQAKARADLAPGCVVMRLPGPVRSDPAPPAAPTATAQGVHQH